MAVPKPQVYVGLLRGVNVGGKNKLPSATLKAACERAGFKNVQTYLQSGNVVFTAAKEPPARIAERLQAQLKEVAGLDVSVLVRTAAELRALLSPHPFGDPRDYPGNRVAAVFLDGTLSEASKAKLEGLRAANEQLKFGSQEVFAFFPDGMGRSDLANALHGKTLGVTCTARNWNTVSALVALADALEA
ncbi:MAG TPA: DUF1697 domain-containing protein [Thermoanaerobaculia bacterium]|jgi:uncharacterized protein (DUF1697 family)